VEVQVEAVYVNHTSKGFMAPFRLDIDKHLWLEISENWISGDLYYIDILTTRGTHIDDYYKAF